jgi:hypothetical protein
MVEGVKEVAYIDDCGSFDIDVQWLRSGKDGS